ncbi:MAG: chorismate synthase [Clostridia bacterium]|nr:chorismate synthase [Clostridia bacterium]
MSAFGNRLKINVFGESHGPAVGVVIDGLAPGIELDMPYISAMLDRRRPGTGKHVTGRNEDDAPEILSGVYNGRTTGMPLCAVIRNNDARSGDYERHSGLPRPGHSDFTAFIKYKGFNDHRGGGAFSGRLTAPIVFAGAIAKKILEDRGIIIVSHLLQAGGARDITLDELRYNESQHLSICSNSLPMIDRIASNSAMQEIEKARMSLDSIGSSIETAAYGVPAGTGEPGFDSIESRLSAICFGVPGVKAIGFGKGFGFASMTGSAANDSFHYDDGSVRTKTNNAGGILGGISNGMPLVFTTIMKPTPSIARRQDTVDLISGKDAVVEIKGRHDPCIGIRAVPVMEACTALVLLDFLTED